MMHLVLIAAKHKAAIVSSAFYLSQVRVCVPKMQYMIASEWFRVRQEVSGQAVIRVMTIGSKQLSEYTHTKKYKLLVGGFNVHIQ